MKSASSSRRLEAEGRGGADCAGLIAIAADFLNREADSEHEQWRG
jgi:hypothetical protein